MLFGKSEWFWDNKLLLITRIVRLLPPLPQNKHSTFFQHWK